jgi:hypothetical protein
VRSYGLTETSRLGCQVKLARSMDGMQVTQALPPPQQTPAFTKP